jgi:hypothetical protein
MSLTRAEWLKMWRSLRYIEKYITAREIPRTEVFGKQNRIEVIEEIDKIKEQIQSVVGQLE